MIHLECTNELIQGRNHLNVLNVERASVIVENLEYTNEFTRGRNHLNVLNVERASVKVEHLEDINELTQRKNHRYFNKPYRCSLPFLLCFPAILIKSNHANAFSPRRGALLGVRGGVQGSI
ncbi:Hypothetical predicted protein [Podarcis lilfordi]|uniref:Uncharacterized protein n=1 Tax=Podarcis lilfordi TaxID=74358 RepID=A0AA35JZY4_9SAUR|nr:Hypothetical predicted protein [Podarcis lilfordi]